MKIKQVIKEQIGQRDDLGMKTYNYRVLYEDGSFELYTKEQAYDIISLAGKLGEAMGGQGYTQHE